METWPLPLRSLVCRGDGPRHGDHEILRGPVKFVGGVNGAGSAHRVPVSPTQGQNSTRSQPVILGIRECVMANFVCHLGPAGCLVKHHSGCVAEGVFGWYQRLNQWTE